MRQWWAPRVAQARHHPNAACRKWGSGCGALPLPVLLSPFLWIWQGWEGREEAELNRREGRSTQCDHAVNNLKGKKKCMILVFHFLPWWRQTVAVWYWLVWGTFCFLFSSVTVLCIRNEMGIISLNLSVTFNLLYLSGYLCLLSLCSQSCYFFFFSPLTIYFW